MYVGRDDQAAVLACFDETATTAFAALCQLCAGDADLAVDMLAETYGYLARMAASSYGIDVDRRWIIDAAHSVYAARAPETARHEIGPVAALTPPDRVILRLHDIEHRGPSEIGLLLGVTLDDVERSLTSSRAVIAASTTDAFSRGDVWLDDAMRAAVRARIGGSTAAPATDDGEDAPIDGPPDALISRRTMIGTGATASIAALIGLGLWFGSSGGDEATKGNDLPEAPTTTTPPTTDPPTTTEPTETTDPTTTDETIVLGNDDTTSTTSPRPRPTGYIIDPIPDGLVPAGGYFSAGDDTPPFTGWFQLWASADAAHTAGRWLAINAVNVGWRAAREASADTRRQEVGGRQAMVTNESTGIVHIVTATTESNHVDLLAYGIGVDQLSEMFGAMELTADDEPVFGPTADAVLDGLDLRVSRPATTFGLPVDIAINSVGAYFSSPDGSQSIDVYSGPQTADDLLVTTLLGTPSSDPAAVAYAPNGTIDIAGRHIVVIQGFQGHLMRWHQGNETITLSGSVPLGALLEVVANLRVASEQEWQAQINASPIYAGDTDAGLDTAQPELVEVTPRDSSSVPGVVVRVSTTPDESGQRSLEISSGDGTLGGVPIDPTKPVTVYIDIGVTIIVVVLESPGTGKKLRVSLSGRPAVIVPLVPLGDDGAYGGAYAFSEITDFHVAVVDTDGTLIQELDA